MQSLRNLLLWVFLWPVKLAFWLWQQETIGKAFAVLWLACFVVIGLGLLPKQVGKIERPAATSHLAASLQPTLLTLLRNAATPLVAQNADQTSTLSKAALLVATATLIPATPTDLPVITATPLLIPSSTPLLVLIATATPPPSATDSQPATKSPTSIPTVTPFNPSTPAPQIAVSPTNAGVVIPPTAAPAEPVASNPGGFVCAGGCSEAPDPSCAIKGNVNAKGDKIYHMPGSKNYDLTRIKPAEGDRWFCIEQEAQDAGFRAAKVY